jgi:hypothetical protein
MSVSQSALSAPAKLPPATPKGELGNLAGRSLHSAPAPTCHACHVRLPSSNSGNSTLSLGKHTRSASPPSSNGIGGGRPALTDEERQHYTRLAAQRIAQADRAEAERLRREGREAEATAFEKSAAEADRKTAP